MANKYLYNGKEMQEETGWLDYGARMYMADIGRWGVVDPLAAAYHQLSPYSFVSSNPITNTEVDGRYFEGKDGKKVKVKRRKGKLKIKSDNASDDLKYLIGKVNETGSRAAVRQVKKISNNKTKVHVVVDSEPQLRTRGAKGQSKLGIHNAHDENGNEMRWDDSEEDFDGTPAYAKDSGNSEYKEATITIFTGNINESGGN